MSDKIPGTYVGEAVALFKNGHYKEALRAFMDNTRRARNQSVPPDELCRHLNDLATAYLAMGKYNDSESILKEAFALLKTCDREDRNIRSLEAACLCTRSNLRTINDKFEEAAEDIQQALLLLHPESQMHYIAELQFCLYGLTTMTDPESSLQIFERFEKSLAAAAQHPEHAFLRCYLDEVNVYWPRLGTQWDATWNVKSALSMAKARLALARTISGESDEEVEQMLDRVHELMNVNENEPRWLQARVLLRKHDIASNNGDWKLAIALAEEALAIAEVEYGKEHPALIEFLMRLAGAQRLMEGDDAGWIERATKIAQDVLGDWHPLTAKMHLAKVSTLLLEGPSFAQEREALCNRALEILRDVYEDDHSDVVLAETSLAKIYSETGRINECEQLLKCLVERLEQHSGQTEQLLGITDELVALYDQIGNRDARLKCMERQTALIAKLTNRVLKIGRLSYLSQNFSDYGNDAEAERLLLAALSLSEGNAELEESCKIGLCRHYANIGNLEEARKLLPQILVHEQLPAMKLRKRTVIASIVVKLDPEQGLRDSLQIFDDASRGLPECWSAFLFSGSILCDEYLKQKRIDEAHRIVNKLISERHSMGFVAAVTLGRFVKNIARAYAETSDIKAETLYQQAIDMAEDIVCLQPELMDELIGEYTDLALGKGDLEKASTLLKKWGELRRNSLGEMSHGYASTLLGLAITLSATRHLGEADEAALKALRIYEELDIPDEVIRALEARIDILRMQNRHLDANDLLERIVKLKEETSTVDDPTFYTQKPEP
ncbi:MAG: tetratricopeptide repeat protein [Candidatus Obscuribacterales bacterium]|nr:tetratricopeptide repeat protein [Candidatus Obscuribacterales bacterium]